MDELAAADLPWVWPSLAVHPDVPVQRWRALVLDADAARRWRQGATIAAIAGAAGPIRTYDDAGEWLGTGHADAAGTGWRPEKVVPEASAA
jgi:hypothetical protein